MILKKGDQVIIETTERIFPSIILNMMPDETSIYLNNGRLSINGRRCYYYKIKNSSVPVLMIKNSIDGKILFKNKDYFAI